MGMTIVIYNRFLGVCQGEKVFKYPDYYLGQYHFNHIHTRVSLPKHEGVNLHGI